MRRMKMYLHVDKYRIKNIIKWHIQVYKWCTLVYCLCTGSRLYQTCGHQFKIMRSIVVVCINSNQMARTICKSHAHQLQRGNHYWERHEH